MMSTKMKDVLQTKIPDDTETAKDAARWPRDSTFRVNTRNACRCASEGQPQDTTTAGMPGGRAED